MADHEAEIFLTNDPVIFDRLTLLWLTLAALAVVWASGTVMEFLLWHLARWLRGKR